MRFYGVSNIILILRSMLLYDVESHATQTDSDRVPVCRAIFLAILCVLLFLVWLLPSNDMIEQLLAGRSGHATRRSIEVR